MVPYAGALRVLVLATTFPARAGDGTPEFVLTLSAALSRSGHEVTVLAPRVPGAARVASMDGVDVRRFGYFPRRWEDLADGAIMPNLRERPVRWVQVLPLVLAFQYAALREVRRARPDVIHAHWIVPAGLVALVLRIVMRVPYVVTVHGADAYTLQQGLPRVVKRAVVRRASATVPVSSAIGKVVGELGPVEAPVPMGIDLARVREEVGPRRKRPGRVLFIGRLVEKKGVNVLLEAIAQVPDAHLVVVGDGPSASPLREQADRLGLGGRVEFRGQCSRAEVLTELSTAALVALPSQVGEQGDQDGVPVVLGEAVAGGVPVVASRIGGLSEHLRDGETGSLVTPGSASELAEAISRLIASPYEAEAMAARAFEDLAASLDLAGVEARYARHLEAAAGSQR